MSMKNFICTFRYWINYMLKQIYCKRMRDRPKVHFRFLKEWELLYRMQNNFFKSSHILILRRWSILWWYTWIGMCWSCKVSAFRDICTLRCIYPHCFAFRIIIFCTIALLQLSFEYKRSRKVKVVDSVL
jgi:hypothetical protein